MKRCYYVGGEKKQRTGGGKRDIALYVAQRKKNTIVCSAGLKGKGGGDLLTLRSNSLDVEMLE